MELTMEHVTKYKEAFSRLIQDNLLRYFEAVNTRVFMSIATGGPKRLPYEELDNVITKDCNPEIQKHDFMVDYLKSAILEGEEFSHYSSEFDPITIDYFVNRTSSVRGRFDEPLDRAIAMSVEVVRSTLSEDKKTPLSIHAIIIIGEYDSEGQLDPELYNQTIKHEIAHVVLDYIKYFVDPSFWDDCNFTDEEVNPFTEFICDFTQYAMLMNVKNGNPIEAYTDAMTDEFTSDYADYYDYFLHAVSDYLKEMSNAPIKKK